VSGAGGSRRGRVAAVLLLAALAIAFSAWRESRSLERGNRLFRRGETVEAERLYRALATGRFPEGAAVYNLGTTLLAIDPAEAGEHLRAATEDADPEVSGRSHYNLGFLALVRATGTAEPEVAIPLLEEAVSANRAALRLDPYAANARWNLALAQRMLDSLTTPPPDPGNRDGTGTDEVRMDDLSITRSETGEGASGREPDTPQPGESTGRRTAARDGAREAWTFQDPGPLTPEASRALLAALDDDVEELIRGILWSMRPDVAWWSGERTPGGEW
jgi:tetratricopeptide (TPR) repeat protein